MESDSFNAITWVSSLDRDMWKLHFILDEIFDPRSWKWPLLILGEKEMSWQTQEKQGFDKENIFIQSLM